MTMVKFLWKWRIPLLVLLNGVIYLTASTLSPLPQVTGAAGLLLGLLNFLVLRRPRTAQKTVWAVLSPFIVTLLGSVLGVLLMWSMCATYNNITSTVCIVNNFRGYIFSILAYAQVMVIGLSIWR